MINVPTGSASAGSVEPTPSGDAGCAVGFGTDVEVLVEFVEFVDLLEDPHAVATAVTATSTATHPTRTLLARGRRTVPKRVVISARTQKTVRACDLLPAPRRDRPPAPSKFPANSQGV